MRKYALILASSSVLTLLSAIPALAYTGYTAPGQTSGASNFSDPDEQVDALAGSSDDSSDATIAHFGGSQSDATRQAQKKSESIDKDTSYSGFYFTDN